jgi:adenylate kinase family enzyme
MKPWDVGLESVIRVEKVSLVGPGVLILTGPSSCGKGQVANAICKLLSVDQKHHLSMGEILRSSTALYHQGEFPVHLEADIEDYFRSSMAGVERENESLRSKVLANLEGLSLYFKKPIDPDQLRGMDWLEYSTYNGLLIPNHWTEILLEHHIDQLLASNPRSTLILDGYPRTVEAAQHLITYFKRVSLPILKVIHLSISREEMMRRATIRGREDDSVAAIYRRFEFYVEKVHPSIDYLKEILGSDKVALVDAHQPVYETKANGEKELDVKKSILRICVSSLRALGVPRIVIADLLATYEI